MKIDNIKGIIFDYGGTIDSHGDHWSEIIYDGYLAAGLDVDKDEFRQSYVFAERYLATNRLIFPQHNFHQLMEIKIGLELGDLAERGVIPTADVDKYRAPIALYCYQQARSTVRESARVISHLAESYPMVLVSNFYGNIESVLLDMGIRDYFRGIIESATVGVRKPDVRIFSLGVLALGLKPEEVLVVGDSYRKDIAPALSLGCKAVWIKGKGWGNEQDPEDPGVPVITHLSQLPDLLK